ncbi:MAG: hypothetical protein EAX96_19685 [Candidatus Lokiarchaeota archaeon]|nr:hypothetical protein [Candidatus Lokiarchaeota archaeon]
MNRGKKVSLIIIVIGAIMIWEAIQQAIIYYYLLFPYGYYSKELFLTFNMIYIYGFIVFSIGTFLFYIQYVNMNIKYRNNFGPVIQNYNLFLGIKLSHFILILGSFLILFFVIGGSLEIFFSFTVNNLISYMLSIISLILLSIGLCLLIDFKLYEKFLTDSNALRIKSSNNSIIKNFIIYSSYSSMGLGLNCIISLIPINLIFLSTIFFPKPISFEDLMNFNRFMSFLIIIFVSMGLINLVIIKSGLLLKKVSLRSTESTDESISEQPRGSSSADLNRIIIELSRKIQLEIKKIRAIEKDTDNYWAKTTSIISASDDLNKLKRANRVIQVNYKNLRDLMEEIGNKTFEKFYKTQENFKDPILFFEKAEDIMNSIYLTLSEVGTKIDMIRNNLLQKLLNRKAHLDKFFKNDEI